jgi:hypothetical protein
MAALVPNIPILEHRLADPVNPLDPHPADDQTARPEPADDRPFSIRATSQLENRDAAPAVVDHRSTHPLSAGQIIYSPGCHFAYRVLGPCCRLFDREQLPWPSCRLEWRSKEPSWRRVGKRYVVDMATQHSPSYSVEIIGQRGEPLVMTLYGVKLSPERKEWWYSRRFVKLSKAADGLRPFA